MRYYYSVKIIIITFKELKLAERLLRNRRKKIIENSHHEERTFLGRSLDEYLPIFSRIRINKSSSFWNISWLHEAEKNLLRNYESQGGESSWKGAKISLSPPGQQWQVKKARLKGVQGGFMHVSREFTCTTDQREVGWKSGGWPAKEKGA